MRKSILFVDKDTSNLQKLKSKFSKRDYDVHICGTGEEALKIFAVHKPNMIVSDTELKGMEGLKLLKKIKNDYPLALRLIMSSGDEENRLTEAFNSNLCKYYLIKPWEEYDILRIIEDIFELQEILRSKELLGIINSLENLPCLPETYLKVNEMIEDEMDIEYITAEIEKDAALSAQLLRMANTAFYAVRTSSLKTAVMNIGLSNTKNLILTIGIFDFFNSNSFKKKLLWKHALLTNRIVEEIYDRIIKIKLREIETSAGLLHDIGKIVLFNNYPANYLKIFDKVENESKTFNEAEKEVLNFTHNEVGAYLLDWWNLPISVVQAALHHEKPLKAIENERTLTCVVHAASYYAWKFLNIIVSEKLDKRALDYIGTTNEECLKLVRKIKIDSFDI